MNKDKRVGSRSTHGHLTDPVWMFVEGARPYVEIAVICVSRPKVDHKRSALPVLAEEFPPRHRKNAIMRREHMGGMETDAQKISEGVKFLWARSKGVQNR
jgi:hypothetical protein